MIYIFYHDNCIDGICAGALTYDALIKRGMYPIEITIRGVQYGEGLPQYNYQEFDKVYIVDFSYPRDVLLALYERCKVIVLDHHASAQEQLADLPFAKFDMQKSGAGMVWDYFYPDIPMPIVVQHVQDRDLWQFKLEDTKAFSAGISALPNRHHISFWQNLIFEGYQCQDQDNTIMSRPMYTNIVNDGKSILKQINNAIESFLSIGKYKIVKYRNYVVALFNTTTLISELGEAAYNIDGVDFSMSYFVTSEGKMVFNLRSPKGGVNVKDIAVSNGGGGHVNAAGFTYDLVNGCNFLYLLYNP